MINEACNRKIVWLFLAVFIAVAGWGLNSSASMSPVWYGPYLSGAANLTGDGVFRVDYKDLEIFSELSPDSQQQYRFSASENAEVYDLNPVGYVYVAWIAKKIFPFLSDVHALEALQLATHVFICLAVLILLGQRLHKALFFFMYAVNPVVLYFVVFPYYYFWQVIPAFLFLMLLLTQKRPLSGIGEKTFRIAFFLLAALGGLLLSVRPTILAILVVVIGWSFFHRNVGKMAALASLIALSLTFYALNKPMEKNFYHTVYVGVGAYPNAHVPRLSDDEGYAFYERETGQPLNASIGGNYYEIEVIREYRDLTRAKTFELLQSQPLMFVRNAALNYFQGFTVGYVNGQPYALHIVMAALGLAFVLILLYLRQFAYVIGISASLATFVPYYPPIPAYMYGSYLLLVCSAIVIIGWLVDRLGSSN